MVGISRTAVSLVGNRQLRRRQPAVRVGPTFPAAVEPVFVGPVCSVTVPSLSAASPSPVPGLSERGGIPTPDWLGPLSRRATLGFLFRQQWFRPLPRGPKHGLEFGPNCSTGAVVPASHPHPAQGHDGQRRPVPPAGERSARHQPRGRLRKHSPYRSRAVVSYLWVVTIPGIDKCVDKFVDQKTPLSRSSRREVPCLPQRVFCDVRQRCSLVPPP
jgi:hypothetical protein